MNTVHSINHLDDIQSIVRQSSITIITSYRGKWCPFCRQYLSDMNKAFRSVDDVLLVGVSVDSTEECNRLRKKLKLGFDLIPDESIVLHKELGVKTGKGHGKDAYLQPAVFVFHDGVQVFQWIQTPKMLNFGGAINRLPIEKIIEQVEKLR